MKCYVCGRRIKKKEEWGEMEGEYIGWFYHQDCPKMSPKYSILYADCKLSGAGRKTMKLSSEDRKRMIQPYGEKGKKEFAQAYGFLPKTNDKERDKYEEKQFGVKKKSV